jgi:outer membrane immunogenic protein
MKKILLVGASLFAIAAAGGANAADLPVYTKAPRAIPYNWTGFYLGIEGGAGWGNAIQSDNLAFNSGTYQPNGAFVGGTIGYNWQVGSWVYGLEGDASWADIGATTPGTDVNSLSHLGLGSTTPFGCGGLNQHCSTKLESIETARARLGYAFGYVMPYVTGGFAAGTLHGDEGDIGLNGAFGSGNTTVYGWTAGAGVEAMILPRWTVKLEGLYTEFGKKAVFNDNVGGAIVPESIKFTPSFLKIGVNYKLF